MTTHRKLACLLGAASLLSFVYFYEGGGWNQNSRFDLLRAILERHTLTIDAYHENTEDKAHFQGHYYSDKAPGLVFFAVPFAIVARAGMRVVGVDPDSARGEYALSWMVSAWRRCWISPASAKPWPTKALRRSAVGRLHRLRARSLHLDC